MAHFPDEAASPVIVWRKRSPLKFFLLVFGLTLPFWVLGAVTGTELLPGLPISALAAFCPVIAALILVYQENKAASVIALLKRAFDFQRISAKIWYAPTLLLMPVVMVVSYGVLRFMGTPVPAPHIVVLSALALFVIFFISALGEELGWSGYITDPLQQRWGVLQASIVLGSGLGKLAFCGVDAGSPISCVDRLVVAGHRGRANHYCLALQSYGEKRLYRSALSYHGQRDLATISSQWFFLRSPRHEHHHGGDGDAHCRYMAIRNVVAHWIARAR